MADVNPPATIQAMDLTSGVQQPLPVVPDACPLPRVLKDRLRTDRQHVVVVCNSVCARAGKSVLA